jgi:hypothetical protein
MLALQIVLILLLNKLERMHRSTLATPLLQGHGERADPLMLPITKAGQVRAGKTGMVGIKDRMPSLGGRRTTLVGMVTETDIGKQTTETHPGGRGRPVGLGIMVMTGDGIIHLAEETMGIGVRHGIGTTDADGRALGNTASIPHLAETGRTRGDEWRLSSSPTVARAVCNLD